MIGSSASIHIHMYGWNCPIYLHGKPPYGTRDNGALYGGNLHNAAKILTVPFDSIPIDLWPSS